MARRNYWERENSERSVYPDPGGMQDQDSSTMADIGTFGWLVGFANAILDEEDEALKKLKEQGR